MPTKITRKSLEVLKGQLSNERSTFKTHWRDLGDFILPRRPRFFVSDTNRGERRNLRIIDSTATVAARTLSSGMMAGVTSPARPWFRLTTPDPNLQENGAVRSWLHAVTERMLSVFLRSNLYNSLPTLYKDMGVFGTAAMWVEEDFERVLHTRMFQIGDYMVANDSKGRVRICFREFRMTVRQIVEAFGEFVGDKLVDDNLSQSVRDAWRDGQKEMWIDVNHVVMPNPEHNPKMMESRFKPFVSIYYEAGSGGTHSTHYLDESADKFLRVKGYENFPLLCPRWEVAGSDSYATSCPGMEALGDVKQLQTGEKRLAQAIEKIVNPPMVGPSHLKTVRTSILPGDLTYSDEREGQKGLRPIHEVNIRIGELEQKQEQVRRRIRRSFFEDLFLMISSDTAQQPRTATEIAERSQEKLLALGPVLEQLNQGVLDPLIDICFTFMANQGLIPEPPEELQGMELRVEYISIMAQAQKQVGLGAIERYAGFIGQAAGFKPDILDKLDEDALADAYGESVGVQPDLVRATEDAQAIRQQRAQAQAQAQQMESLRNAAAATKDLANSPIDDASALGKLAGIGDVPGQIPEEGSA